MYINIHIYICIYQTYIYTYIFFHAYILQSTFQLLKRMSEQLPIFHYLLCFSYSFPKGTIISFPFPIQPVYLSHRFHATRTTWVKTFPPKAQHVLTWTLKPSPQKNSVICCLMLKPLISADDMWTEVKNYSIWGRCYSVHHSAQLQWLLQSSSYWFWSFIVSKVRPLRQLISQLLLAPRNGGAERRAGGSSRCCDLGHYCHHILKKIETGFLIHCILHE